MCTLARCVKKRSTACKTCRKSGSCCPGDQIRLWFTQSHSSHLTRTSATRCCMAKYHIDRLQRQLRVDAAYHVSCSAVCSHFAHSARDPSSRGPSLPDRIGASLVNEGEPTSFCTPFNTKNTGCTIYMKAVCVSTPEWSKSLTWSFRPEFFRSPFATASRSLLDCDDHVNLYHNYHKQRQLANLQIISTNDWPKRCSRCRHRLRWHGVCSLCYPLVTINLSWSLKIYKIKAMQSKCHGNI